MMINSSASSIGTKTPTLQVKIISTENIKPSTPTPVHLKYHKLSLLDHFFGTAYVPHILFYNATITKDENHSNNNVDKMKLVITRLKDSLSKTLSLFYPLAGRLTADESTVDCNDEGIAFVEAQANITLGEFLQAPNRIDEINKFLPGVKTRVGTASEVVPLVIQVSTFECGGGLAVGSQYLHKIMDGASWGIFLNNWAAFMGECFEKVVAPDFATATTLFPPCSWACKLSSMVVTTRPLEAAENKRNGSCVVKAFIFSPQAISNLQAKVKSELVPNPTRIETLSGFIWKYAMTAAAMADVFKSKVDMLGPSVLIHQVNMRPRTKLPIPAATIGNLTIHSTASYQNQQHPSTEKPYMDLLHGLVAEIRKSFSEAKDAEYLSRIQGEKGAEELRLYKQRIGDIIKDKKITTYTFTSWSKLDMLPDFGFGMPLWIGFSGGKMSALYRNVVVLVEIPDCGGIEAWLILDEKEMDILLSNEEFLQFASPST